MLLLAVIVAVFAGLIVWMSPRQTCRRCRHIAGQGMGRMTLDFNTILLIAAQRWPHLANRGFCQHRRCRHELIIDAVANPPNSGVPIIPRKRGWELCPICRAF